MQQKTLTVVIPTYNMEKYLRRCLDSLIVGEEQMAQLEVLVVNDGSKDSSSAIAHEYEKKYPQTFRVIDKENGNYGSCVNRGIDEARGKYFRILDADDRYLTENFGKFIDILKTAEADMVVTNFKSIFEDKEQKEEKLMANPVGVKFGEIYKAEDYDFYKFDCDELCCMHALTYKLEILKEVGLRQQTGISYTDTEYTYFPLVAVKTVLHLNMVLYLYYHGREGQTCSPKVVKKSLNDIYKVSRRVLDDFIACPQNKEGKALRNKQLIIMERAIRSYLNVVLCMIKKNEEDDAKLVAMYNDIKKYAPEMLPNLRKMHNMKILYHFYIWEKTGKYMTDFPFNIFLNTLSGIRSIVKGKDY